jgi:hypothetical protein
MSDLEAIRILTDHNAWRRGGDGSPTDPVSLGVALERAIATMTRLEAVQIERDRLLDVIQAATVLISARGRHNTMIAYQGFLDAIATNVRVSDGANNQKI